MAKRVWARSPPREYVRAACSWGDPGPFGHTYAWGMCASSETSASRHGIGEGFGVVQNQSQVRPPARRTTQVLGAIASDIKIAHSIFAMPFALLGAFLARPQETSSAWFAMQLGLIVLAMVFARTWAMLFNRLVDRQIDAGNPRTAKRALPSGRLQRGQVIAFAAGSAGGFIALAASYGVVWDNWYPAILSIPVLAFIAFYSLTKRFTILCHVFLGGALAISPICAAIAVNPESLRSTPALWWLGAMVLCWVAGFDIIYAFQDIACDREAGLKSVPARLGTRSAAWISRMLHGCAAGFLVLVWQSDVRLGVIFLVASLIAVGLLFTEHMVFHRRGLVGLNMAFFTLNGIISCMLGLAGIVDLVL